MTTATMTTEQIEAINAACQMIMDATGCTSAEAMEQLIQLFDNMLDVLSK